MDEVSNKELESKLAVSHLEMKKEIEGIIDDLMEDARTNKSYDLIPKLNNIKLQMKNVFTEVAIQSHSKPLFFINYNSVFWNQLSNMKANQRIERNGCVFVYDGK